MSRASLFVSSLLVFMATQALAAPTCVDQAIAERTGKPAGSVPVVTDAPDPIYVEIGPSAAIGDQVRFEIRVDGVVSLTETVELTEAPAVADGELASQWTSPVVELLAAQPARLDFLRRAAERGTVEVVVVHGPTDLGLRTLDDLEASSAGLTAVNPFGLRSSVATPGAEGRQTKFNCEQYCDDEQDSCYLDRCGQFGSASCYDACDIEWLNCLESCGICQPSSTSSTVTTIVSTTPTSNVVCTRSFFNPAVTGRQRAFTRQLKHTTTTTTTNSDCSQTVTTSISYSNTLCWQWINFNSCPWLVWENPAANC